jgi:DNA-binding ferritin-like protein
MSTTTKNSKSIATTAKVGTFIGKLFSFNNSLKLYHWHVTGKASYAQHIALDQAIESLVDTTDRITETTYAMLGDIDIVIPETKMPKDIVKHAEGFFDYVGEGRPLFPEAFTQAILDDYQEAVQQLIYRLKRLQ